MSNQDFATDTRQRIAAMLEKITSESNLNRIYRFTKYLYIHRDNTEGRCRYGRTAKGGA